MTVTREYVTYMNTATLQCIRIACFLGLLFLGGFAKTEPLRFIALGDLPYRAQDEEAYYALIQEINRQRPQFSIFVGDTKSGGSPCSDAYLRKIHASFNLFEAPLIYTPGDNEWTDCHRLNAGAYDPVERLQFLRALHFADAKSQGKNPIALIRQSDLQPQYSDFVENTYWISGKTLFATVHIVGSNNNFAQQAEYVPRNRANLAWLETVFSVAKQRALDHLVLAFQADLFYSPKSATSDQSGLRDSILLMNKKLAEWAKPALIIHGDSHRLIIDQPFKGTNTNSRRPLHQVYRVQVMGDEQVEAVEITIDGSKNSPFSFRPLLLPPKP
jgi:hypothetical protein